MEEQMRQRIRDLKKEVKSLVRINRRLSRENRHLKNGIDRCIAKLEAGLLRVQVDEMLNDL